MSDEFTAKLDTYLDGELPANEMKTLDGHVRNCSACAADVLSRLQLKRAVQFAGKRYSPSAEFRARVQRQITTRPRLSWVPAWVTAAALMAVLLVGTLVATYVGRQRQARAQAFSEVADLHVATLASANPVDVLSTDRHTVKPWFQGKIPFTFNLPELQNSEFTLLGGRVAYLGQAPGAQLIYQVRKHEISVFIFPEGSTRGALPSDSGPLKHATFNFQSWDQNGLRYIMVGDASADDLSKLADLLKTAARS
jgi:anti-sigma factor RsiW